MPGSHQCPHEQPVLLLTHIKLEFLSFTSTLSEPSQIEVRLLLAYSSSSNYLSSPSSAPKMGWSDSIDSLPPLEAAVEGNIPFSKSVKVYIMPKPARR